MASALLDCPAVKRASGTAGAGPPAAAAVGVPPMPGGSPPDDVRRAEAQVAIHRGTTLALVGGLAGLLLLEMLPRGGWAFVALALAHLVVVQCFVAEVRRGGPRIRAVARVMMVFPILAITAGIHVLGEVGTACGVLLYGLLAAPGQDRRFSGLSPMALVGIEIVAFTALQVLEGTGLVVPRAYWHGEPAPVELRIVVTACTGLLLVCAAVLAERTDRVLASRTRALEAANRALAEQNAGLARVQQEVERYATAVAHDLANPLAAAVEGLGALRGEMPAEAPEARELAELTQRSVARALEMLAGLRDITRTIAADERRVRVSMGDVVRDAVAEFELTLRSRGIRLELPSTWPTVVVQRAKMIQVWRNLIGNALKYGTDGAVPTIRLFWERTDTGWAFGVRDNGPGIPAGSERRVFEPFERLADAEAGPPGMGLGLTLVKRIVEHHGGVVTAESAPAGGAVFRFTVPAPRAAAAVA